MESVTTMSTLNPILAGSAQSVEAYQQVIEQTSQAVVQWLEATWRCIREKR
ncbi:hypothetical protein LNP25_24800 [Klebsiella variicola subsp. variicola]|nr:hypothetical protein [Klebsiella variicola subsp. variicola]